MQRDSVYCDKKCEREETEYLVFGLLLFLFEKMTNDSKILIDPLIVSGRLYMGVHTKYL